MSKENKELIFIVAGLASILLFAPWVIKVMGFYLDYLVWAIKL